jgi:hypothetical protein
MINQHNTPTAPADQAEDIHPEAAALVEKAKGEVAAVEAARTAHEATGVSYTNTCREHAGTLHDLAAHLPQRQIAAAIGMSVGYVNTLLQWHDGGFVGLPFAAASKKARERKAKRVQATEQRTKAKRQRQLNPKDQIKQDALALCTRARAAGLLPWLAKFVTDFAPAESVPPVETVSTEVVRSGKIEMDTTEWGPKAKEQLAKLAAPATGTVVEPTEARKARMATLDTEAMAPAPAMTDDGGIDAEAARVASIPAAEVAHVSA